VTATRQGRRSRAWWLAAATVGLVAVGAGATVGPAAGSVTAALVCPDPQNGCGSSNHNEVRL